MSHGKTETDEPRSGLTQSGLAQSGLAQSGLAQSGLAQSGLAQSELAQSRLAQSGLSRRGVAIAALIWIFYTVFYAALLATASSSPFPACLKISFLQNGLLVTFFFPVWWMVLRWLKDQSWVRIISFHALIGPICSFFWFPTYLLIYVHFLERGPVAVEGFSEHRWWFFLTHLIVYFLQFAIYHVVRTNQLVQAQEKRALALAALARESELTALKSQINPHFLFNALNLISASVPSTNETTRVFIRKLANLMRYPLDAPKHDLVALSREIAFLKDYLEFEQERLGERLQFELHVDERCLEVPVPPMILQPLVENALRHGIGPKIEGGRIKLIGAIKENRLEMMVEDDGIGIKEPGRDLKNAGGVGLKNTDMILKNLFGVEAGLKFKHPAQGGFSVWFSIPLMEKGAS